MRSLIILLIKVSGNFVPVFNYYIYKVLSLIVIKWRHVNVSIIDLNKTDRFKIFLYIPNLN